MGALGVHRLNRRFELEPAGACVRRGRGQRALRLCDHRRRPLPGVLLGKRDVSAFRRSSRRAPRLAVEHQGEQAPHLGLRRQPLRQHAREPDRFVGEAPSPRIGAGGALPAAAVGGVDRFEDGLEPLWQLTVFRHFEGDAGVADLRLGSHQPLPHRRG